ncbi:MAG: thioredoxin family protein [Gammaproteobacteria bacterium]|nr:thioredoxin family protein [Gammaproteobacteria bacterium]
MKKLMAGVAALIALAAVLLLQAPSVADDRELFSEARFNELTSAGQPVLIDVYAPWCPTCRKQSKVLGELLKDPQLTAITVLKVDYDDQKEVVARFQAPRQSTLVMFKGTTETGRLVAETSDTAIRALLLSGLTVAP